MTDPQPLRPGRPDPRLIIPSHILASVTPIAPLPSVETPEECAERVGRARQIVMARFSARLPRRYATASLADLTPEQDPDGHVSGYLDGGHQTLLLASPKPGLGKTHAAYAVAAQGATSGLWVEAWTVSELLSVLRREMRTEPLASVLDHAHECDLLVLDDLGRENATPWAQETVHNVLDVRLREARRTIITTNLTADEMGERYGYPLLDRIVDDAVVVKVTGESRRSPVAW